MLTYKKHPLAKQLDKLTDSDRIGGLTTPVLRKFLNDIRAIILKLRKENIRTLVAHMYVHNRQVRIHPKTNRVCDAYRYLEVWYDNLSGVELSALWMQLAHLFTNQSKHPADALQIVMKFFVWRHQTLQLKGIACYFLGQVRPGILASQRVDATLKSTLRDYLCQWELTQQKNAIKLPVFVYEALTSLWSSTTSQRHVRIAAWYVYQVDRADYDPVKLQQLTEQLSDLLEAKVTDNRKRNARRSRRMARLREEQAEFIHQITHGDLKWSGARVQDH